VTLVSNPAPMGAVLCGGDSRRMGRDKALIPIDGEPMAGRVAAALAGGGCDVVVLVGGDRELLQAATGRNWVPDRWPGEGPLGGLLTALSAGAGRDVVVAACDLPDLDADAVRAVISAAQTADADVAAVVAVTTHPHLVGWWRASSESAVRALYDGGERGIRRALRQLRVVEVPVGDHVVRNVNTPDDIDPAE
jgi:molybdopterin-guanine dinucleotide biosynthesis protein A